MLGEQRCSVLFGEMAKEIPYVYDLQLSTHVCTLGMVLCL